MAHKSDGVGSRMTRRIFTISGGSALAALALKVRNGLDPVEAKENLPREVKVVSFSESGQREDVVTLPLVI
jgi:peptide-methionine (R)-S-oxide reductase